jgi:hypothetical protein
LVLPFVAHLIPTPGGAKKMDVSTNDDALRSKLGQMLADGLQTDHEDRPDNSEQASETTAKLQNLQPDDYEQKLVIAGFMDHPRGDEEHSPHCGTCMYFLLHRKYCQLPELDLPVEPQWSCILWRI